MTISQPYRPHPELADRPPEGVGQGQPEAQDYYRQLYHPRQSRRRLVGGFFLFLALAVAAVIATTVAGVLAQLLLDPGSRGTTTRVSPVLLLTANLGLAALGPISILVDRLLFRDSPGSVLAARGGLPWRAMLRATGVLLPIFVLYGVASLWVMPTGQAAASMGTTVAYLAVVLITTPLQAAGEEIAFRGFLGRLCGGAFARRALGVGSALIVPSLLFMLAHGAGDLWLNAYYLVFGLSLAVLSWRTGDIGRSIVLHVLNNTVMFVISLAVGLDLGGLYNREAGTGGPFMLVAMLVIASLAGTQIWLHQRSSRAN